MACPSSWGRPSGVPVADREDPADPVDSVAVVVVAVGRAVLVAGVADRSN
jgi:hypothetical protein